VLPLEITAVQSFLYGTIHFWLDRVLTDLIQIFCRIEHKFADCSQRSFTFFNMNRAKIVLVGTGRMGAIRAKIVYGNPRIEFCGVVDLNKEAAQNLASTFNVSDMKDV
jgi:hypothetical protein